MRNGVWFVLVAVVFGWLAPSHMMVVAQDHPYRMEGIVFERDLETGIDKPVAGAAIRMLDVAVLDGPGRIKEVLSDERGRYSMEVSLGHNAPWILQPPPGYVAKGKSFAADPFVTTAEAPVYVKNYEVVRGTPLRIVLRDRAKTPVSEKPVSKKRYASIGQQNAGDYFSGSCDLDAEGVAVLTIPKPSGKFDIGVSSTTGATQIVAPASVEFEEGFELKRLVESVEKGAAGEHVIKDAAGKTATFSGCEPLFEDKKLTIALDALKPSKAAVRRIKGRLVDAAGKRIVNARLDIRVIDAAETKAVAMEVARTDKNGEFSILAESGEGQKATLVINCSGYVPRDVMSLSIPNSGAKDADLGEQKLEKGNSIRVRAVGKDGLPLVGAVVAPREGMAMMANLKRTDEKGECELTDLPTGLVRVDVGYGDINEACKITVQSKDNELLVLKAARVIPKTTDAAPKAPDRTMHARLLGRMAPELTIVEWTDGKYRKLSDYRGKVVFLEFGGVWCSACETAIPAIKELQEKYEKQGVVFLSIHTAGTDMSVVKRHLEHVGWKIATGIDAGDDIQSGHTTGVYSIVGYPTKLIIGGDGKIAFSTDFVPKDVAAHMKGMEDLAKSLDVPWPLDSGLDRDADSEKFYAELRVRANKLLVAMLSRELDAVLKKGVE